MAQEDVKQLLDRAKSAWDKKRMWEDELEDVYDYAMPNRNKYDEEGRGSEKNDRIYDSTAIESTQAFASKLQNKLTPPFEDWFSLKPGPILKRMMDDQGLDKVNAQLDEITEIVNQVFNTGTFNSAIHEFYLDLATGQAGMLVQPGDSRDRPVRFTTVNRACFAIEEGAHNEVDTVHRKMKVKTRTIRRQWPDADIPKKLEEKIEESDDDEKEKFWEITYEGQREDSDDPTDTIWYYDVIWRGSADGEGEEARRIVERTYRSNPWVVARWSKLAGENEGRGPLLNALPDIRTLNKVVELTLKNASLAVSSPYTVASDGVTNPDNVRIAPGALIPVARNGGPSGPSLQPLPTSRNFDVGQLMTDDLRGQVKQMLFDSGVPEQMGKTPNSATEIAQRVENLQEEIGGSFGRLFKELIVPLVQRVLDILYENRMVPQPVKVDTLGVVLSVTSPLARGQNVEDIQTVMQWVDMAAQVGGQQAVMAKAKPSEMMDFFAEKLGIPQRLLKNQQEEQQFMEQMKQVAQQAAQAKMQAEGQGQQTPPQGG